MIHPSQNYVLGTLGVAMCINEGKEVEVSMYARDEESGIHYYSGINCKCAWAGTNLQYLEYLYEKNLCK